MAERFDICNRQYGLRIDESAFSVSKAGGTRFADFVQQSGALAIWLGFVGHAFAGAFGAAPVPAQVPDPVGQAAEEDQQQRVHNEQHEQHEQQYEQLYEPEELNTYEEVRTYGATTVHDAGISPLPTLPWRVLQRDTLGAAADAGTRDLDDAEVRQHSHSPSVAACIDVDHERAVAEARESVGHLKAYMFEAAADANRLKVGIASTQENMQLIETHFSQYVNCGASTAIFRYEAFAQVTDKIVLSKARIQEVMAEAGRPEDEITQHDEHHSADAAPFPRFNGICVSTASYLRVAFADAQVKIVFLISDISGEAASAGGLAGVEDRACATSEWADAGFGLYFASFDSKHMISNHVCSTQTVRLYTSTSTDSGYDDALEDGGQFDCAARTPARGTQRPTASSPGTPDMLATPSTVAGGGDLADHGEPESVVADPVDFEDGDDGEYETADAEADDVRLSDEELCADEPETARDSEGGLLVCD